MRLLGLEYLYNYMLYICGWLGVKHYKIHQLFLKEHCIANKTHTGLIIMQLGLVSYSFQYSKPSPIIFLQESSFAEVEGKT